MESLCKKEAKAISAGVGDDGGRLGRVVVVDKEGAGQ